MRLALLRYNNYRVKVKTRNKRWIEGTVLSTDENTNIVLDDAEEFAGKCEDAERRLLGLVLVRGDFITSVEIINKPIRPSKENPPEEQ